MTQDSLFDVAPYRVETTATKTRPAPNRVPVSGIQWRRTGLVRDCFACSMQQASQYDPSRPMAFTRRSAKAQLQIWDDDGELTHDEFYCKHHAEKLGWDGSRSYDRKRRRNIEAEAKTALAFKLDRLVKSVRPGTHPASFEAEVSDLVRKAGGWRLDMPEWTVTSSGLLVGHFTTHAKRSVDEWAEQWRADITTEQATRHEYLITAACRIIDAPATTVRVSGYITAA